VERAKKQRVAGGMYQKTEAGSLNHKMREGSTKPGGQQWKR
jgi:hypothetical protein